jgi:hypothetical protein
LYLNKINLRDLNIKRTSPGFFLDLNELCFELEKIRKSKEGPWCKTIFEKNFLELFSIEKGSGK